MTTHHSLVIDNEGLFSLLTNLFNCLFFSKGKFEKIKPATRGEEGRGHCEEKGANAIECQSTNQPPR